MSATNLVAFDLGAESGRAVLGRLDAGRLTLAELHRFANTPVRMNGHLLWNLPTLWENLKQGLRKAAAAVGTTGPRAAGGGSESGVGARTTGGASGGGGAHVTAGASGGGGGILHGVGIDTWGVDFGLLDRSGEILGLPVCYRDSRTDGIMERTFRRVSRERIFQATGIQFMQFNTLFQLLAMRECGCGLLDAADRLLMMPDLLHFLLTGRAENEFSAASTTQMYDPRKKDWARDLLVELDLPSEILGPVVSSGTVLGPLADEVAAECNIPPVPVITPASHDTASAVASVPADGTDWCYISSGTWSLMGVELAQPIVNEKSLRYNYTNEGGVGGSIRFLKNIMGLWPVQECRRHWAAEGQDHTYNDLAAMAGQAPAFLAVVDPDHQPFLSPGDMPAKIARFCRQTNQKIPAGKGEFVRVCLEGLALAYRRTLEGLEDVLGRRIGVIHIVGGGSQNQMLNQMAADACGRPVVAGPVEAAAIGNLLCQAMAIGQVGSLAESRAIVRASFDVKRYDPRPDVRWADAYERFRAVSVRS